MFHVDATRRRKLRAPIITDNYELVLFDDAPILYTGTNAYGNYIIGSSIDEEQDREWRFHLMVTEEEFFSFSQRRKSYRSLMEQSDSVFVMEFYPDSDTWWTYPLDFYDIPVDYRPLETSYYPLYKMKASFRYKAAMIGGIADRHLANPQEVSGTVKAFADLIGKNGAFLNSRYGLKSTVYMRPATASSFGINYEIQFEPHFFLAPEQGLRFVNKYLEYILNSYPKDAMGLLIANYDELPGFKELVDLAQEMSRAITDSDEDALKLKSDLAREISGSTGLILSLIKSVGTNYYKLAIANVIESGEAPLGVIGTDYKSQIEYTLAMIKRQDDKSVPDPYPTTHTIRITGFNRRTGHGWAVIKPEADKPIDDTPIRIKFARYKEGLAIKYTKSLHSVTYISVVAVASRKGDRTITQLVIAEESEPGIGAIESGTLFDGI